MAEVPEWYTAFVGAVVARLPRDIDVATAEQWALHPEALGAALQAALFVSAEAAVAEEVGALKNDKTADGWTLLEDMAVPGSISGSAIELASFLDEDEEELYGEDMVARAAEIDEKLGQRHTEYLLEHQDDIPETFRGYSLVFPGTVWLGTDQNHHVPCLNWRQGKWELVFGILEGGVDSSDALVRARA